MATQRLWKVSKEGGTFYVYRKNEFGRLQEHPVAYRNEDDARRAAERRNEEEAAS